MADRQRCAGNPENQAVRDPTERFSDRVADYVRYRPGYPDELVGLLENAGGLDRGWVVADVGSGTGISSQLFLRNGYEVLAVEPNDAMRAAAEASLGGNSRFRSVRGTAERTTLGDRSVDLVVAGQAFHWFDAVATRAEFSRILRGPDRFVALFWNARLNDATPFLREYEDLLIEHSADYQRVDHRNIGAERLGAFFGGAYETRVMRTSQAFDLVALQGRLLSSSYAPPAGDPRHEPMIAALRRIFDAHQQSGKVEFLYDTEIHYGPLHPDGPRVV